jgi:transcriptional regulator with XRE-family HTH domain
MADESFGQVIKRRREELGMTQAQLAERLGVHKQTIVKYEAGSINIASDRLIELAGILGMTFSVTDHDDLNPANILVVKSSEGADVYLKDPRTPTDASQSSVGEPPSARHAVNLPYSIRVFLDEFRLRITKGGASEEEVDRAIQLLRSPSLFTWYSSGTPRELPEGKVLQSMKAIAESVIIPELRERGRDV